MLCCAMFKLLLNTSYGQCVVCVCACVVGSNITGKYAGSPSYLCLKRQSLSFPPLSRGACVGVCMHARAPACVCGWVYMCARVCVIPFCDYIFFSAAGNHHRTMININSHMNEYYIQ